MQTGKLHFPNGTTKAYPKAPRSKQVDIHHGVEVADPFRPLERLNSPRTTRWVDKQNDLTREYIDQIPEREPFEAALREIRSEVRSMGQVVGQTAFFTKSEGLEQSRIFRTQLGSGKEEVILDPNTFSSDGSVSIDQWEVSPDGQYLAYGLRRNGTDEMEWRVRDVREGKDLPEQIRHGRYGADTLTWSPDSKGFFYQQYKPRTEKGEITDLVRYDSTRYHIVGTPQEADQKDSTPGLPSLDWEYRKVDGAEWSRIGDVGSANVVLAKGPLYPKGAILSWDEEREEEKVLVAESGDTLEGGLVAHGHLLVNSLHNAHSRLTRYDTQGKELGPVELPGEGTVTRVMPGPDGKVFYTFSSPTQPHTVYSLDMASGKSEVLWQPSINVPMERYVTRMIMCPSEDGTEVPVYVTHRRDVEMDGKRPTYLYAYGGFNVNETPTFNQNLLPWLDKGGVYAHAALRGGGEFGENWHKDGSRLRKQNVFNDFIAAGEGLVKAGITAPEHLGIGGGSNGGLLVAATQLQRPDLFGAAIPEVGVHDMLRFAKYSGGFHWIPEYGEVEKSNHFKNMMTYSPVHNVKDGQEYPPTMVMTGDHDDRVVPSHSYKLAAELQDSQGGDNPILLRTQKNLGHGYGAPRNMRIEESADRWAFLWHHLGEAAG
jgi:prolyl oligopeptidase